MKFPIHHGTYLFSSLFNLPFKQSCWWDFLGVASDIPGGHNQIEISNFLSPIILLLPLLQWFHQINFFIQQTEIITENSNQSKWRIVKPSSKGYIYSTAPTFLYILMCWRDWAWVLSIKLKSCGAQSQWIYLEYCSCISLYTNVLKGTEAESNIDNCIFCTFYLIITSVN